MLFFRSALLICAVIIVSGGLFAGPNEDTLRDLYTRIGLDDEAMICNIEQALVTYGSDSERLVCAGIPDFLLEIFDKTISYHSGRIKLTVESCDPEKEVFWETIFDAIYAALLDIKSSSSEKGLKRPRWQRAY
jgi:hypothetical protein